MSWNVMRRAYGLVSFLGGIFMFGCAQAPTRIGTYALDEAAGEVLNTYAKKVLQDDLERVMDHVFAEVDNGDKRIDHDEAYEAINRVRPHTRVFVNAILEEKSPYYQKKEVQVIDTTQVSSSQN